MSEELQVQRKQIYDASWEEFVDEELPTVSVKDAHRVSGVGHPGSALVRKTLSGGTVMRLTYLRVAAGAETEFFLCDRDGTFDYPFLEAAGDEVLQGAANAPVHVVKGSFVMGVYGSYASGTRIAAYEGIVRFRGTETRA